jgi:hypothetical protein
LLTSFAQTTPTFTEVGEPVVLIDAMQAFLGTEVCLNKTFSHLAMMVRCILRVLGPQANGAELRRVLKQVRSFWQIKLLQLASTTSRPITPLANR